MIDNFIFSISTSLPIFLVMSGGYLLKRNRIINDNFIVSANKMVFYIALPIKLFNEVRQIAVKNFLDVQFISFIVIGTLISAIIAWILSYVAVDSNSERGAFIQGAFRGNFLYLGFSLVENITGSISPKAPIVVAVVVPLYNILAVLIFSLNQSNNKQTKISVRDNILGIMKNPLIIAIFCGVFASVVNLQIPVFASRTMEYFQDLATPLALLSIGATFNFKKISSNIKSILIASTLKLVIVPLIAVFAAIFMGFENSEILLIYVLFGVPTATVSFIIAVAMNGDKELTSSIIMVTTLLSVVTMTLFIFAFRVFGII